MSDTLQSPGSFTSFSADRIHPAVQGSPVELRRQYDEQLSAYRIALAAERGVSLDQLHAGIIATAGVVEVKPVLDPETL